MQGNENKKVKKIAIVALVVIAGLAVSIALLIQSANRIIKEELEQRLGKTFSVDKIDLGWGRVEATGVKLKNTVGKEVIRIESASVNADFMGVFKREYIISSVKLKGPYIFVEVDRKGNIVNPILQVEQKQKKTEKQKKTTTVMRVKNVEIAAGSLDYYDRKTSSTPLLTQIRNINLEIKNIRMPLIDVFSPYVLSAKIPSRRSIGVMKSSGKINLKTKDTDCKMQIRSLDLVDLKPYFRKNTTANMTKGFLDLDLTARVLSNRINAPGKAILKDLEFGEVRTIGKRFVGVPLSLVLGYLKKSNNEISVSFVIKGNLENPQFGIQEEFMTAMAVALAGTFGFSIEELGKALLDGGAKGGGDVGTTVIDIGKGLEKIFGK